MKNALFAASLLLSACSHNPFVGPAARPQLIGDRDTGKAPPIAYQSQAEAALIYQIFASVLQEPEKARQLWGRCVVRSDKASNIYTPCQNVEIGLRTEAGHEVANTHTDNGEFSFEVEKAKTYRLKLKSALYQLPNEQIGPFQGGDGLTIELAPSAGRKPSQTRSP